MERKKLCLIIPSLQTGGMQRVMSELAGYFCQKSNVEVHLVLYGKNTDIFYYIPDTAIIYKPKTVFNDKFRQFYTLGRLFFIRQTVKKIKPDAILSFGEYWNSFVLLALFGLPHPVFISDRCSPDMKFGAFHKFLRKILYNKAEGVIAQTEKARQLYNTQFKNFNISVIGNPIRKIDIKKSTISRENIVLTVGRLIESKHHDKLIEVFADIQTDDWQLVIVGDDALNQKNMIKLKKLIHELKMDDKIILAGNQSDVDSFYLKSQIFAFASSSEGFPNVIGEAMSAGLPVVSFDCVAGPEELIHDSSDGFLVPLFEYDKFKEKLKLLMNDQNLCRTMGKCGSETIQRFSIDIIGTKFYDFMFRH